MNKYIAEFLGTLFFLFVILATGKAIPIGLALAVSILVLGKYSGGNFNPAVSVGLAIMGQASWSTLWIFLVACFAGGAATAVFKFANPEDA